MCKKFLLGLLSVLFTFSAQAQDTAQWQEINQNAKQHLIHLINIDTAQPNPNELAAARYIYKVFNKNHIDWDIFIPRKGTFLYLPHSGTGHRPLDQPQARKKCV